MPENQALHRISEVSERTGLSVPLLRQWERRYGFPDPDRTDGGHRLYSPQDIADLHQVKAWVDQGMAPAQAVERLEAEPRAAPAHDRLTEVIDELEDALLAGRLDQANGVLSRAHQLHPLDTVLLDVIGPVLHRIGQRWHDGEILISQEHRASDLLRGKVRGLLGLYPSSEDLRVVAATVPGERHEIGLLIASVLLGQAGFHVDYVGSDLPLTDLGQHAQGIEAQAVVLSSTRSEHLEALPDGALAGLAETVVIGGQAVERDPSEAERLGVTYVSSEARDLADALRARAG